VSRSSRPEGDGEAGGDPGVDRRWDHAAAEPAAGEGLPRLYTEFAAWWPLLSAPEDYEEEAGSYLRLLRGSGSDQLRTALELGSGGGNNASHLKAHLDLTLVDLSPGMLEASRALNPECEHVLGDMRSVRLDRTFDAVFVHDALAYLITEDDLRRAVRTAHAHCRPGGAALFVPDFVRETFRPGTDHGGHDGDGRALRYLEWRWDPDPTDDTYLVDYAYLLREGNEARAVHDRHVEGLFGRDTWLRLLQEAGFDAAVMRVDHTGVDGDAEVFLARRRR
jgi:SAM-dependent methyltransferase